MDIHTLEAQQQTYDSGWRFALKLLVIALGLGCGAILGLIGAFYFNLITINC